MSKPFHVYLDLNVFNNDTNPTPKAPSLYFEETRTQPFLEGTADDYFVAIARFTVQTGGTLPVFIPAIDTTQSDPNQTVYTITLAYRDQVWGRKYHIHSAANRRPRRIAIIRSFVCVPEQRCHTSKRQQRYLRDYKSINTRRCCTGVGRTGLIGELLLHP